MDDRHARHRRGNRDRRRRPAEGFRAPTTERFDRLVDEAVRGLPPGLLAYLDGVRLAVAEVPPPDPLGQGDEVLLGRYEPASPTRSRDHTDRLVLFRRPLEARARDRHDLVALVRHTVVTEIAVRFGLSDEQLGDLGW